MQGMYSTRSPAVKRLMKEAQELSEATEQYYAQPLDDNLFEWHFTIRGPSDSDFSGGLYHGRIVLPPDYPMKPPSIILLTPNGRFETNKKICLSISGHHPESWQPSWSIRTALLAIIGFMPTHGAGAIGSLDYTPEERKRLANRSKEWKCPTCGNINCILKAVTEESEESKKTSEEAKELASQINFQAEKKPEDGGNRKNGETTPTPSTQQPNPQIPANTPNPFFPGGFPFPSPLMCMPNMPPFQMPQGVAGNATVPRFPPPPPFIPGMFPPGSGQNVFMQQWQMNPFMMGRFPVPPTMFPGQLPFSLPSQPVPSAPSSASQRSTPASSSETPGSRSKSSTVSAAVKSQTPGVTTSQKASQNVPNTKSSSSTEDSVSNDVTESSAPSEISTQGSENPKQEPEKSPPGTESNPEFSTSLSQQPTGQRSTEGMQSPPGTESIPSSSTSLPQQPTGQRSNEGVKQRLVVDNEPVRPTIPTGRVGQSAELRDYQSRRSGFSVSSLIIFIIGLAIALLLIRRFFLSRNWRFYYGV